MAPAATTPLAVDGGRALRDPRAANVLYHDAAASSYDEKWSISFDGPALDYVRRRAERMLPRPRYGRVLELGAGTGFFILNLWRAGYVGRAHATDISPGMLEVCARNAERLGCRLEARTGDAESLPYGDGTFDLVVGHAFLHHVPDPRASILEARRVLRPGGALLIAGEPTRWGHRLAGVAKLATRTAFRTATVLPSLRRLRAVRAPARTRRDRILRDLEFEVDLHTFDPAEAAEWVRGAGFRKVRTETEELTAALLGWSVRTLEGQIRAGLLGPGWSRLAFLGWRALYRLDEVLYRLLPRGLFYNLLLYAER